MSKCLGLEKSNSGYREEQDYEIKILRENKKSTKCNQNQTNLVDDKEKVDPSILTITY